MENNPNPTTSQKIVSETDVDYSLWKIFLVAFLGVVSAAGAGFFIAKNNLLLSAIFVVSLFVFFCLQAFLIKGFGKIAFAVFLQSVGLVSAAGFVRAGEVPALVLLAAGILFFVFILLAERAGRNYAENCLKLDFFKTAYFVLPKAVIGVIVFVSVIYGAAFNPAKMLSPAAFSAMLRPFSSILNSYSSGLTFDSTMRDFLAKTAEKNFEESLQRQLGAGQIESVSSQARAQAVARLSAELQKQMEAYFGPIDPDKTIGETLYSTIDQRISRLLSSLPPILVSLVVGVIVFIFLKSIAFLFFWPTAFLGFIIYELMIITNFARVSLEARSREIVLLN